MRNESWKQQKKRMRKCLRKWDAALAALAPGTKKLHGKVTSLGGWRYRVSVPGHSKTVQC